MLTDRKEWAIANARQSASDLHVYEVLQASALAPPDQIEECHRLHYLQMACEKIAKAYRFRDTSAFEENLTTSLVAFSKFIENFIKSSVVKQRQGFYDAWMGNVFRYSRKLAEEIERLAPAVDRLESPANAEYPWWDGNRVVVPCEFGFPNLSLLRTPSGRKFLKIVKEAIHGFAEYKIS